MNNYDIKGIGTVKISEEVIGVISAIAASEIKGVSGLEPHTDNGITTIFTGKKGVAKSAKGIKVTLNADSAVIDMNLSVQYGFNIPEVVEAVQKNVATTVETITGLSVSKVNILVNNIVVKEMESSK